LQLILKRSVSDGERRRVLEERLREQAAIEGDCKTHVRLWPVIGGTEE
jgi:hypothetical protein